jgi:hypothetical protein
MWGNDGDDTIETRGDTFRDFIRCGDGLDTMLTDAGDWADHTCENRL